MIRRRPRIAIATNGRFHVLDLARELAALDYDVLLYSMLPDSRCEKFGLDRRYCRSLLPFMAPALAWERAAPGLQPSLRHRFHVFSLNRAIISRLEPCDIFIGMSGLTFDAARYAKRKFGARIVFERGSKHILEQADVLRDKTAAGPSPYEIARELDCYSFADRIVIPADHVAKSFQRDAPAEKKLFINPYGVDLALFPARDSSQPGAPKVLFVGGWQYRKGADILFRAVQMLPDVQLVHVGGQGDLPFPENERFTRYGSVNQAQLSKFYCSADVFALASREEGLALVQLQALASGLPVVCSDQTGGRDLRLTPGLTARIDEVPVEDVDAFAAALARRIATRNELPRISEADRSHLSWSNYGKRYSALIEELAPSGPTT